MDAKVKSRKGQLTMFIVIAIIIVVVIIAIVLLMNNNITSKYTSPEEIKKQIEKCTEDQLTLSEEKILSLNGYKNLTDNYILYYGKKVPYMCTTNQFYTPCVNQEPMFIEHVRRQIENDTSPGAKECIAQAVENMKNSGFSVNDEGNYSIEVEFDQDYLRTTIYNKLVLSGKDQTKTFEKYVSTIKSPLYRLLDTERNIVNYESTLCEFNSIGWMKDKTDIRITRYITGDATKIYTLNDKETNKNMSFAVKSCPLPAGI